MMDPAWEKWGLAWDMTFAGNRYFEIHSPEVWDNDTVSPRIAYRDWLKDFTENRVPNWNEILVLQEQYFPNSTAYPLDDLRAYPALCLPETNEPYLESSLGWMLAMAFLEHDQGKTVDRIGIWGVDLTTEDEYTYQRPNISFLIGFVRGSGIPVIVPEASALYELKDLDDRKVDFETSDMERYQLEYLLGRYLANNRAPERLRSDLMTSSFSAPPRYGYCDLHAGITGKAAA